MPPACAQKFGVDPELSRTTWRWSATPPTAIPASRASARSTRPRADRTATAPIEQFPADVLGEHREHALLFKNLATLRTDAPLFDDVDELRWGGPTGAFGSLPAGIVDDALAGRVAVLVEPSRALTTISGIPASARDTGQSLTAWSA